MREVTGPHCQQQVSKPHEMVGLIVTCPRCRKCFELLPGEMPPDATVPFRKTGEDRLG